MTSTSKAIELQLQVKQNAEELQDFMRDLENWEKDIKQKDMELRKQNGVLEENLPPIRNGNFRKKKKGKAKESSKKTKEENTKNRIKSYDYEAWAKLDVDSILDELDKEDSTHDSVSQESESEEDGIHVDSQKALALKEKGNRYFKQGKYDEAVDCYTKGMDADPYNPVLPTNRASAYFRMRKFAVAESDCNLAIALNRSYTKAYARRGAARFALQKLEDAKKDYEKVLELEPNNFEATNELRKINQALTSIENSYPKEADTIIKSTEGEEKQIEEQQHKQQAISEKDLGNGFFKEGKYERAIECYTRGIAADGTNALLPANRAMAYLKIQKYEEAEKDCTQAILLDGSYSKAFARRGTARTFLGKLSEAKQDFETVLLLEPGNKQAITELSKIKKELIEKGHWDEVFLDSTQRQNVIKPIENPPHLGSTKPLKKVIIEETGNLIQTIDVPDITTAAAPERNPANSADGIATTGTASKKNSTQDDLLPTSDIPRAKVLKIEEISNTSALPPQGSLKQDVSQSFSEKISTEVEKTPAQLITIVLPSVPGNSFQLESDFRQLKSSPDMLYQYLKQIEPSVYPKLFQKNLDPDVFNQIIKILHDFYIEKENPSLIFEILQRLSELKRFDMAVMFMSEPERKIVHVLFNHIDKSGLKDKSVEELKKRYGG
ncbi:RNA polymerase II-associated protein 3 [Trichechus manatus latirostris]|uniref:RNA polymerase II-associated protein 3 n=1 Tax=Trichechus manatus latirostris TaxID=127582 RepID=A0A2Y9RH56_TRIMA|nr:RNA polymerase II-associated protein 3 [Trichechus manatus latirostris]XP_023594591.1 RNA polymerase II-associated protein 3 [Trichechus manatus latirostris]XP_023594592.1 RNA polymerase II-associated protein 3 [Trichechus manatus latirostris]XP_023594593.1 RNA polymerase II-associated protein 3 [Trichechus manatus latirostris]XP_023594594.1 RNA polymerase II-associated protein 3 [Trichechus manatus latirostris]XP_023594595.1 RNA polymerase II-associated protein 3 [Trichechus manatus latiro